MTLNTCRMKDFIYLSWSIAEYHKS